MKTHEHTRQLTNAHTQSSICTRENSGVALGQTQLRKTTERFRHGKSKDTRLFPSSYSTMLSNFSGEFEELSVRSRL